jgi:hypothetical protein
MNISYADCGGGGGWGCWGWDWWGFWFYIDPFAGVEIPGTPVYIDFTYISSWTGQWSDCNDLNSSLNQCTQVQTFNPVYATGYYTLTPIVKDGIEIRKDQTGWPVPDAARPSDQTVTINITIQKDSTISSCVSKIADSVDPCSIEIPITAPTKENKSVSNLTSVVFTSIEDISGVDANRIDVDTNPSTNNALILSAASIKLIGSPGSYKIVIPNIRSVSPFAISNGSLQLNYSLNWISDSMLLRNINYHFTKPFYGILRAYDDNKATWTANPNVGTSYDYRLDIFGTANVSSIPTNTKILPSNISTSNTSQVVEAVVIESATLATKDIRFKGRINTNTSNSSESLTTPTVRVSPLEISYGLSGRSVKYLLTSTTDPVTTPFIELWWSNFIGIRVVWQIQGSSKAALTSGRQDALYFKAEQSAVRNDIRKNIATTTRARTSWTIVNGVKYITWDYTLTTSDITDSEIETIVVDGGNLTIKDNIAKKPKTFWLVVLLHKDKTKSVLESGNILISKNVTSINGLLYADGALFSTDESGDIFDKDVATRNTALNQQLIINGSIITTNSIWWATNLSWGKSVGLEGTTEFEQAMIYDLNYFRKDAVWCDKNSDGDCSDAGEYPEPMVVIYDPRVISSPPKGFTVR